MRINRLAKLHNPPYDTSDVFVKRNWIEEVNAHLNSLDDLPLVLVGGTGIGKTSVVYDLCKKNNMQFIVFHISQMNDIGDFLGFAIQDRKTGKVNFNFLDTWNKIFELNDDYVKHAEKNPNYVPPNDKRIVLFFDEYNRGSKDILAALFSLFSDYRIKGIQLSPLVIKLVGSINPVGEFSVQEDDPAFKARVGYLNVEADYENWTRWLEKSPYYYNPKIVKFLKSNLSSFSRTYESDTYEGEPSPRSWTRFMNAVYYRKGISKELAIGILGRNTIDKLEAFIKSKEYTTFEDIEKNFDEFTEKYIKKSK